MKDLGDKIALKGAIPLYNWLALFYAVQHDVGVEEALRQVRLLAAESGMKILELRDWVA